MFITNLSVKNWRNFQSFDVHFQDVTYIIGPNASGKSNFLDVFRFLRDIANPQGGGLQQALNMRGGLSKVRCLAARRESDIEIEVQFAERADEAPIWTYTLEFGQKKNKKEAFVVREIVKKGEQIILERPDDHDQQDPRLLTQTALEQVAQNGAFREIADCLSDALYLHLVPQLLKYGNELAVKRMTNDPFGQGFLENLAKTTEKTRTNKLKTIENILKEAIPGMDSLQFERDDIGQPHLRMRYAHWRPKAGWQNEDDFSDGTLRLIALVWILLDSRSVVLIEEPELSLHEAIVEKIPELIQRAAKKRKKNSGQLLISTHSSTLLNSPVIKGQYLTLNPRGNGEGTRIEMPTTEEENELRSGLTPADILLPKTHIQLNLFEK